MKKCNKLALILIIFTLFVLVVACLSPGSEQEEVSDITPSSVEEDFDEKLDTSESTVSPTHFFP